MWKSRRRRKEEEAAVAEAARLAEERRREEERAKGNRAAWLALVVAVVGGVAVAAVTGVGAKAWEWVFGGDPIEVAGSRAAGESYPYWTSDNPGFSVGSDPDRHSPKCSIVSVVPKARAEIQPPDFDAGDQFAKISEWVTRYGAADPDRTMYAFTVTAKDKSVTLQDARVVFVRHDDRPKSATLVQLHVGKSCGAGGELQEYKLNLDDPLGRLAPSSKGTTGFPYALEKEKSVNFRVLASTDNCDCVWYIELKWVAGGTKGTTCIMDGSSSCPENLDEVERAFHTAPSSGYRSVAWTLSGPDRMSRPWARATFDWTPVDHGG